MIQAGQYSSRIEILEQCIPSLAYVINMVTVMCWPTYDTDTTYMYTTSDPLVFIYSYSGLTKINPASPIPQHMTAQSMNQYSLLEFREIRIEGVCVC